MMVDITPQPLQSKGRETCSSARSPRLCDSTASIPDIYIVLHIQITVSRLCNGPVSARHYTLRGATTITQFGGDEESWSQGEDRRWTLGSEVVKVCCCSHVFSSWCAGGVCCVTGPGNVGLQPGPAA